MRIRMRLPMHGKQAHPAGNVTTVVKVDARAFATVHPDAQLWMSSDFDWATLKAQCAGVFIRVRPPKGVDAVKLSELLRTLEGAALAVKVEGAREDAPLALAAGKVELRDEKPREIVLSLAARARGVDQAELLALVERVMAEEGL